MTWYETGGNSPINPNQPSNDDVLDYLAQIMAIAGRSPAVVPQGSIFFGGVFYENPTSTGIGVPDPLSATALLAAGLTPVADEADLHLLRAVLANNAPAEGTIPNITATDIARPRGSNATVSFADYLVWYSKPSDTGAFVETYREAKNPEQPDLHLLRAVVNSPAPAQNTIPVIPATDISRPAGSNASVSFDNFIVWYNKPTDAGPFVEANRIEINPPTDTSAIVIANDATVATIGRWHLVIPPTSTVGAYAPPSDVDGEIPLAARNVMLPPPTKDGDFIGFANFGTVSNYPTHLHPNVAGNTDGAFQRFENQDVRYFAYQGQWWPYYQINNVSGSIVINNDTSTAAINRVHYVNPPATTGGFVGPADPDDVIPETARRVILPDGSDGDMVTFIVHSTEADFPLYLEGNVGSNPQGIYQNAEHQRVDYVWLDNTWNPHYTSDGVGGADPIDADTYNWAASLDGTLDQTKTATALTNKAVSVAIHAAYEPVNVTGTDITIALNEAIANVVARGGQGVVVVPPGNYVKTGVANLPSGIEIIAQKFGSVTITQLDTQAYMYTVLNANKKAGVVGLIHDADQKITTAHILFFGNCQHPIAEDNAFLNASSKTHNGIYISDGYRPKFNRNTFDNVATPINTYQGTEYGEYKDNVITNWYQRGITFVSASNRPDHACIEPVVTGNVIGVPAAGSAGEGFVRQPISFNRGVGTTEPHRGGKISNNKVTGPGLPYHTSIEAAAGAALSGEPDKSTTTGTADQLSITGCEDFTFAHNYSEGGGDMGITNEASTGTKIIGNECVGNNAHGLFIGSHPTSEFNPVSSDVICSLNDIHDNALNAGGIIHIPSANISLQNTENVHFIGGNKSRGTDYVFAAHNVVGHSDKENPGFLPDSGNRILGNDFTLATTEHEESLKSEQNIFAAKALDAELITNLYFNSATGDGNPVAHSEQTLPITGRHVVEIPVVSLDKTYSIGLSQDYPSSVGAMSHMIRFPGESATWFLGPIKNNVLDSGGFSTGGGQFRSCAIGDKIHYVVDDGVVSLYLNYVLVHIYAEEATSPLRVFVFASGTFASSEGTEVKGVIINEESARWDEGIYFNRFERLLSVRPNYRDTVDATGQRHIASKIDIGRDTVVDTELVVGSNNSSSLNRVQRYINKSDTAVPITTAGASVLIGLNSIPPHSRIALQLLPTNEHLVST